MFHRSIGTFLATAGIVLLLGSTDAAAQGRRKKGDKDDGPKRQTFRLTGKVTEIRGPIIEFSDKNNKLHYVKIDPKQTKSIQVTGTANIAALRSGVIVGFSAALTKRGVAKDEIAKLKILDEAGGIQPGINSEDPTDENAPYWIVGRLKSIKKGKMTVVVGRQQIKAELAETAHIDVQLSNYRMARFGDEISVRGRGYEQDRVVGIEIKIVLAEPLGTPKKKKSTRARPARKRRKRREAPQPSDKDSDDEDAPDAAKGGKQ